MAEKRIIENYKFYSSNDDVKTHILQWNETLEYLKDALSSYEEWKEKKKSEAAEIMAAYKVVVIRFVSLIAIWVNYYWLNNIWLNIELFRKIENISAFYSIL